MSAEPIYLDFENSIKSYDLQIKELKKLGSQKGINYSTEIRNLQIQRTEDLQKLYNNLSAWQIVQVARHPQRPIFSDYLEHMIYDFCELHGDKYFGDDQSIITGLGEIENERIMVIASNKGKGTEDRIKRNFACSYPEGYRKALAKMKFAEKYNIPILTLIDTPGAYPGIESEERGQARAIANNLMEMSRLKTPIVCIIIGEGGSGGALGIGVGDRLTMLQNSYYSVISPEGCSSILWKDSKHIKEAADALKLTSSDLLKLGLIDEVIIEPLGGAQRNHHDTIYNVKRFILRTLKWLKRKDLDDLLSERYQRLRAYGNISFTPE